MQLDKFLGFQAITHLEALNSLRIRSLPNQLVCLKSLGLSDKQDVIDFKAEEKTHLKPELNQSHITIMFHVTVLDIICRLCLYVPLHQHWNKANATGKYRQKEPRVNFHVKTSESTLDCLKEHCRTEHSDICDHLLALSDSQLSQMNHRLSACIRKV